MGLIYISGLLILIGIIIYLVSMRNVYKKQSERLEAEISNMQAYQNPNSYDTAKERLEIERNKSFDDLEDILEHGFIDHIITGTEEEAFVNHFSDIFNEAYSLYRKLEAFHLEPTGRMIKLIDDFESVHRLVKQHNEAVIKERLEKNREFFDHCLSYPLDEQQRRSIVSEEDNCLVVSSAGSGKTSRISADGWYSQ